MKYHRIDELYEGADDATKLEEGIAFAFAKWAKDQRGEQGAIARAFRKMFDALSAIGSAFRGRGYNTPERIFRRIDRGEVGARPRGDAALSEDPKDRNGRHFYDQHSEQHEGPDDLAAGHPAAQPMETLS